MYVYATVCNVRDIYIFLFYMGFVHAISLFHHVGCTCSLSQSVGVHAPVPLCGVCMLSPCPDVITAVPGRDIYIYIYIYEDSLSQICIAGG